MYVSVRSVLICAYAYMCAYTASAWCVGDYARGCVRECAHGRVCGTQILVNIISVILASCIESAAKGPANICFEIFEADAAEQGSRGTSGQLRIFNFRPHVSRLLLSGYVME